MTSTETLSVFQYPNNIAVLSQAVDCRDVLLYGICPVCLASSSQSLNRSEISSINWLSLASFRQIRLSCDSNIRRLLDTTEVDFAFVFNKPLKRASPIYCDVLLQLLHDLLGHTIQHAAYLSLCELLSGFSRSASARCRPAANRSNCNTTFRCNPSDHAATLSHTS